MHAKYPAQYIIFGLKSDSHELPILLFPPASVYVRMFPHHPLLKPLQSIYFPYCEKPSFTPIQYKA
jgi:hypothetical protein